MEVHHRAAGDRRAEPEPAGPVETGAHEVHDDDGRRLVLKWELDPVTASARRGHPRDEYGATIAFLLSDDAGFITGASIPVDGGYLAT